MTLPSLNLKAVRRFLDEHQRLYFVLSYALANGMPSLASLILVMVYTSAMRVGEFGRYSVITALIGVLAIVVELGMPAGIQRDYFDRHRDEKVMTFLANAIRGYMVISFAVLPPAAVAIYFLWPLQNYSLWRTLGLIPVVLLIAYFERTAELFGGLSRSLEAPRYFVAGRVTNAVCTIALGIVFVGILHGNVFGAMLARLFGAIAGCEMYRRQMAAAFGIFGGSLSWPQMRSALKFGLPLLPNRFAVWTQRQGLRPVLAQFTSMGKVGQFSLASSIASMPLMLTAIVEQVLMPVYFKRRVDGGKAFDGKIRQFAEVMMAGEFVLLAGLILFAREAVIVVGGSRYLAAVPACALMVCATFLRAMSSFLLRQIQYSRRTWLQPIVTIPSALLAVLVTVLLAGGIGFMAAAWAVVVSETAMMIGSAVMARRIEPLQLPLVAVFVLFGLLLGLAGIVGSNLLPVGVLAGTAVRLTLLAVIGAGAYAIWIGPNLAFVRSLVSR